MNKIIVTKRNYFEVVIGLGGHLVQVDIELRSYSLLLFTLMLLGCGEDKLDEHRKAI